MFDACPPFDETTPPTPAPPASGLPEGLWLLVPEHASASAQPIHATIP
jgi:hypothetical protein